MPDIRAAKRYAEALISAAEEQQLLDRVTDDMQMLERMMKESRDFSLFLKNPVIKRGKKEIILEELFGKKVDTLTLSFIRLLAEKGREDILGEVTTQFFALRDVRLGIVAVEIRAAEDIAKDQHKKIQERFEGLTNKKVRLAFSVDRQLRGGFLARVGDTVFDGTVKRQLELLRKRFEEGVGPNDR